MIKQNKIYIGILALVTTLILPFSSASAGSGSWDYLGEESFTKDSHVYDSGGGDYKICRDKYVGPSSKVKVELWEYDPFDPNDYVGSASLARGECKTFRNIGRFVDGGDQAEFFARNKSGKLIHVIFYD